MYELFLNSGEIFLNILNVSITASWLVLAVLCARLLLKKAPKWVNCLLWGIVALRLLVPINIESPLSLVPSGETIPVSEIYTTQAGAYTQSIVPQIDSGFQVVDSVVQPIINETSTRPVLQSNVSIIACVWLAGVVAMLVYAFISFLKVKKSIAPAVKLKENIYICDNIATPFILGIVRPKIYLPSSLCKEDVLYVIDHEKSHIKRLDHLWKPLGFLVLSVYWFNPVIWVAYVFLCRDIELACDERAIKEFDIESKKEYSNALINCSSQRRLVSACPLAFGETGVKNRIKSVLSYKRPAFWIIIVSVILCVVLSICFLTSPVAGVPAVVEEKGYSIISQRDTAIYLNIPKTVFNDDVYTEKGQLFREGEVKAFDHNNVFDNSISQTDIYLTSARVQNDEVYLSFKFSYEKLQDCGIIYTGYTTVGKKYTYSVAVRDVNSLVIDGEHYYEDECVVRTGTTQTSKGETEFTVKLSKDAFLKAQKQITFDVFCTRIAYEKRALYKNIDADLERFVEKTILEQAKNYSTEDKYYCAGFIPFKTEKQKDNIKIYALIQPSSFKNVEGVLELDGFRSAIPATITVKKGDEGYSLVDYWCLESNNTSKHSQVAAHFPKELWEKGDNGINYYYDVLHEKNLVKAEKYFSKEFKDYAGKYVYYGSEEHVKPSLLLKENGEAIFNISSYSSFMPIGTYNIADGVLTLVTHDGLKAYTFNVTEKGFEFDAHNSSSLPTYNNPSSTGKYNPVPNKAVFIAEHIVGQNSYFNATILDVSADQILVEPFPDEAVSKSANKIYVSLSGWVHSVLPMVGDKITVCYDGMLQETFPAKVGNTIAVYKITEESEDEPSSVEYHLGNEGIKYVEVVTDTLVDELEGKRSQSKKVITDQNKIQLFIKKFNTVLESSSIDELDTQSEFIGIDPDTGFYEVVYVNVYAVDGSSITVTFLGTERMRLGKNTRRLITAYEREMLLDTLYNSRQTEIDFVVTGTVGKVDLSNEEFLKKAYTLSNDMDYKELCDVFGCSACLGSSSAIRTYYYFNDEYVLVIEEGIQVSLRKIYDPEYRHTIG